MQWVPRVKFQDSPSVKQVILVEPPRSDFSLTRLIPIAVNEVSRDKSGEAPRKPGTSMIIIIMRFYNVGSFFNAAFKALIL